MAVSRWNLASGPLPKADSKAHSARIGSTLPRVPDVPGRVFNGFDDSARFLRPSDKSVLRSIASDIPVVMSGCDRESRRMMRNALRRTCN